LPISATENRHRFRAILAGGKCVRPASVFDPLSARAASHLGFETAMLAGSTASLTVLGDPDLVLLTLTEFAAQARRITRAADLPLLVDADHGYGNALNAMRAVEELEQAGVSAMTIEDTLLPAQYGGGSKSAMIPIAEGIAKLKAALSARCDPSLVIAGRTSAIRLAGLDEAIDRIKAYADAGADAIYLAGLATPQQLDAIAAATALPLLIGGVPKAMNDPVYLAERHVRLALQGHKPIMLAVAAVYSAMQRLRDGADPAELDATLPDDVFAALTRSDAFGDRLKRFMDIDEQPDG
jgi:carboxyvinyl-carboxyphosphonate phosphorylmutase